MIQFKSIEEPEIVEIHERQNSVTAEDIASFFDMPVRWAPMSKEELSTKISEGNKKETTRYFSLWAEDNFIGIGEYSTSWDTWGPYAGIIIWPEFRRKGYGTKAAEVLLKKCFMDNPAHMMDLGAMDWNEPTINFLKKLGFREAGRMRSVAIRDGVYHDWMCFDILKNEYLAARGDAE